MPDWNRACLDVIARKEFTEQDISRDKAAFLSSMWPNGQKLSYCFLSTNPGTSRQQDKVKRVVQEWEKYANIKFDCVKSQDATIRITFDSHDGSWSFIGHDILTAKPPSPTMNLSWVDNTKVISKIDKGVILHQFGHTLGLGHEQDMESIMMYFMPAAMNKQNQSIKPNHDLSDLDKACITINYPPDDNTNEKTCAIDQALDVVKLGNMEKNQIIKSYQTSQWARLQEEFAEWSRSAIGHNGLIINPLWVKLGGDSWATPVTKNISGLSPQAQRIEDGFREMGVLNDSRLYYGVIPDRIWAQ